MRNYRELMKQSSLCCVLYSAFTMLSFDVLATSNQTLTELMDQWLSIESQKGQLQRNWTIQKRSLEQKLSLLKTEKAVLKSLLTQSSHEKSELDTQRLDLVKQQNTLEQAQQIVSNQLQQTSNVAFALLPQLPPPLQVVWQEKLMLLKQNVSSSEKLERLLTTFTLVSEFDERIALNRTSMAIPINNDTVQNVLVTQVYLGLSQGWYISDDGHFYGYGRSNLSGWTWWHNENADKALEQTLNAQGLLHLIDIMQNPTKASFLSLPIKINVNKAVSE